MSHEVLFAGGVQELMLAVERLSAQERQRLVRLVELLAGAPRVVRVASQRKLRRLLSRETMTHRECLDGIDQILAGIERELALPSDHNVVILTAPVHAAPGS